MSRSVRNPPALAVGSFNEREIQMHRPDVYPGNGTMRAPMCCGQKMKDDGGCGDGCCDDWKCSVCGRRIRTEAPD